MELQFHPVFEGHQRSWIHLPASHHTASLRRSRSRARSCQREQTVELLARKVPPYAGDPFMFDYGQGPTGVYSQHKAKTTAWARRYGLFWKNSVGYCDLPLAGLHQHQCAWLGRGHSGGRTPVLQRSDRAERELHRRDGDRTKDLEPGPGDTLPARQAPGHGGLRRICVRRADLAASSHAGISRTASGSSQTIWEERWTGAGSRSGRPCSSTWRDGPQAPAGPRGLRLRNSNSAESPTTWRAKGGWVQNHDEGGGSAGYAAEAPHYR